MALMLLTSTVTPLLVGIGLFTTVLKLMDKAILVRGKLLCSINFDTMLNQE